MKKTIALVAAGVLGLLILGRTTNVGSYVSTLWSQAKTSVKSAVPTKFEIDRIRNDIATLDQELDGMIQPIAEYKVAVTRLRSEVATSEEKVNEQRKVLLDATAAVKNATANGKKELVYSNKAYSVEQVKVKIGMDFESFKRLEASTKARRKLLESKETSLAAAQEKLQQFASKKQEFQLQLAQLEAEYSVNEANAVGNDIKIDNTKVSNIAAALQDLKDSIDRQRVALEYRKGILEANGIPLGQPQETVGVDLDAVRAHLEGNATEPKTASSK
jgi:septal ring factor EnvC (AmiA/AmiB activator)